jgi:hypothetical protein
MGVEAEVEARHRIFGCELIAEAGILLGQPQVGLFAAVTAPLLGQDD